MCAYTLEGKIEYDKHFCRLKCHPRSCTCPPLMYNARMEDASRTCIFADGKSNCVDSSDEFCNYNGPKRRTSDASLVDRHYTRISITAENHKCLGYKCKTGECIDEYFVNDLIPDCSRADDEDDNFNIKRGKMYHCTTPQRFRAFLTIQNV